MTAAEQRPTGDTAATTADDPPLRLGDYVTQVLPRGKQGISGVLYETSTDRVRGTKMGLVYYVAGPLSTMTPVPWEQLARIPSPGTWFTDPLVARRLLLFKASRGLSADSGDADADGTTQPDQPTESESVQDAENDA